MARTSRAQAPSPRTDPAGETITDAPTPDECKWKQVHFLVLDSELRAAQAAAKRRDQTLSAFIRVALRARLKGSGEE